MTDIRTDPDPDAAAAAVEAIATVWRWPPESDETF